MIKILEEVLNILKFTGYNFKVVSYYTNDTDWHIEIKEPFNNDYFITIFPDKWVVYKNDSGEAIWSRAYTSDIVSIDFTEALHMVYDQWII
jgi:hypothetical protein